MNGKSNRKPKVYKDLEDWTFILTGEVEKSDMVDKGDNVHIAFNVTLWRSYEQIQTFRRDSCWDVPGMGRRQSF